jgi:hypothetical protein
MTELDYALIASDVVVEIAQRGALESYARQRVPELLSQCKQRLEDSVQWAIYTELKGLGLLWQFQQVSQLGSPEQLAAYLKTAIPAYDLLLRRAVTQAKRKIIDSTLGQSS